FQAEDGIRDATVTGVQTCALPISRHLIYYGGGTSKAPRAGSRHEVFSYKRRMHMARQAKDEEREERIQMEIIVDAYDPEEQALRSEERRVGKECRSRW